MFGRRAIKPTGRDEPSELSLGEGSDPAEEDAAFRIPAEETLQGGPQAAGGEPPSALKQAMDAASATRAGGQGSKHDAPQIPKTQWQLTDYGIMFEALEKNPPAYACIPERVQQLRISIYLLFEEVNSSKAAKVLSATILVSIVLSILLFMLETMPDLSGVPESFWFSSECLFTIIFTSEYLLRLLVCDVSGKSIRWFLTRPMNIVDCCAVVPFFAVLALRATDVGAVLGVVRTIRLVRLFRIFKLGRHSASLQLMMVAMSNSVQALGVLVFFLSIGCVLFSSLIFHVEKLSCPDRDELASTIISGNYTQLDLYWSECHADRKTQFGLCCNEDDAPLDFPSISAAFWWSIVTMTTVGFGDVYPRTAQGKIIGAMTMLAGILLLALPIALIGAKFQDAYDNFAGKAKGEMERERVAKAQLRPSLMNMSRRMRKLKFQDQKMSQIANDLGKDLEEADTMRKELATFEDQEAEMQCAILDSMEVVLKQCAHLADKAQATKEKRLREEAAVQGSLGRLSRGSSGLGRGSSRSLISCSRSLSSLAAGESAGADVNLQGTLSGGAAPSTAINVPPSVPGAVVSTNIVEEEDRAAGLRRDSYRISQIFIG